MDILNFISWIKGGRVVTTVDPAQTLLPVGLKDNRRDDGYLAGAITVADLQTNLSTPSLQQVLDFNHDLVNGLNFQGNSAGVGQTGINVIGFGNNTCNGNTGDNIIAFGRDCGTQNTGDVNIFIGDDAAFRNSGNNNVGIGDFSLVQNSGNNVNAFGVSPGNGNTGSFNNFMGSNSGVGNVGWQVNALGSFSASNNTGDEVNAFGVDACNGNTGSLVNAFGRSAGQGNQLPGQTIFSTNSFPTYVDATAAAAAINLANGASTGCLYLYYDTTLGAVSAVFPV